jgi:hypothetical protein
MLRDFWSSVRVEMVGDGVRALEGASPRRFQPTYPDFLPRAPPTSACAAFIKESRMRFADANQLDRKSGVRLGRTWATRPEGGACILDPIRDALH